MPGLDKRPDRVALSDALPVQASPGQDIFDRSVYYFNEIPTDVQPLMVVLVNLGAVGVAVLFSVLPALRAAMLHPVRALRFE